MRYGEADVNLYKLLNIDKSAPDKEIVRAAQSKTIEWADRKSDDDAYGRYLLAIHERCAQASVTLSNERNKYNIWLSKSDVYSESCVQFLLEGKYEDAVRAANGVAGQQDGIDWKSVGADQLCLAAEAYYRVGDEKNFSIAQSTADRFAPHHPAIHELKGDFLFNRVLFEAKKDIPQVIEGKDHVRDASSLRDAFEQMCRSLEEARKAYKEMTGGGEVLSKDEYEIDLDDVKVVSEGKQWVCEVYINFINEFLKMMDKDLDEKDLAFTKVIDLVKVEIPKDLPLGGLLQGHKLPSRLASMEGFYDVCRNAYNDRLDVKSHRQRLLINAREKAARAIIRLKILFIIEPIVLSIIPFLLILFFAHFIKNDLAQPLGTIVLLSSAALLVAVVSWAYVQLVHVQNSQLERAVCNVALKDKPCDDNGRVLSNIWDNIKIEHRFTLSSVRAYIKLAIVFFCSISVVAVLFG